MSQAAEASRTDADPPEDRGIPPVNRVRSLQARVSAALAIGVCALLGGGFLTWYYWGRISADAPSSAPAKRASTSASVEAKLPPLDRPRTVTPPDEDDHGPMTVERPAVEALLGPAPPEPALESHEAFPPDQFEASSSLATDAPLTERAGTQRTSARRERSGPVFVSFVERGSEVSLSSAQALEGEGERGAQLSRSLVSTPIPTVRAQRLPDPRFLLPKGWTIDCTLETAVDTALPSLVTCVAATDTWSADGSVVLIERGAKLFGEARRASTDAGARIFVLWTEVRTGSVIAALDSPATDAQGRGGLSGFEERHFWKRFSSATLVSLIDGGIEAVSASRDRDAAIVVNPAESNALLTEVLRSTADIRPTVGAHPGSRAKVLIARDVDFSSVYELSHVTP